MAQATPAAKMLTITIREVPALYSAYMPFLSGGGLFIPTAEPFAMGDEIMLLLTLSAGEKLPLRVKVVWLNEQQTAARPKGVGVAFPKDAIGNQAKNVIERQLAGVLESPHPTYTM